MNRLDWVTNYPFDPYIITDNLIDDTVRYRIDFTAAGKLTRWFYSTVEMLSFWSVCMDLIANK